MPERSDSAVAVRERMAELELKMEDAGGKEGLHRGGHEPLEDVGYDFGDVCGRGLCVDQGVLGEHANVARSQAARLGDETPIMTPCAHKRSSREHGSSSGMRS